MYVPVVPALVYGPQPVRDDLRASHAELLDHVRKPGTWWSGAERVAIAATSRAATSCGLCRTRKASVSPAVAGTHDGDATLPPAVVDTVHRIRTDPARLSRAWFDGVVSGGLDVARYVELVAVTTLVTGLDYFARALGVAPFALPEPMPGATSGHRPAGARAGTAWVPMIEPEDATGPEAGLYGDGTFVRTSCVPSASCPTRCACCKPCPGRTTSRWPQIPRPDRPPGARPQPDGLVAARVSALNQCFY